MFNILLPLSFLCCSLKRIGQELLSMCIVTAYAMLKEQRKAVDVIIGYVNEQKNFADIFSKCYLYFHVSIAIKEREKSNGCQVKIDYALRKEGKHTSRFNLRSDFFLS